MAPLTEPAFARLRSVDPVLAEAAGDAAFELETDLFAALGLDFGVPGIGAALTGLFASRGANTSAISSAGCRRPGIVRLRTTISKYISKAGRGSLPVRLFYAHTACLSNPRGMPRR